MEEREIMEDSTPLIQIPPSDHSDKPKRKKAKRLTKVDQEKLRAQKAKLSDRATHLKGLKEEDTQEHAKELVYRWWAEHLGFYGNVTLVLFYMVYICTYESLDLYKVAISKLISSCEYDPQEDPWGCGWNWSFLMNFSFAIVAYVGLVLAIVFTVTKKVKTGGSLISLVVFQLYLDLSKLVGLIFDLLNWSTASDIQREYLDSPAPWGYVKVSLRTVTLIIQVFVIIFLSAATFSLIVEETEAEADQFDDFSDVFHSDGTVRYEEASSDLPNIPNQREGNRAASADNGISSLEDELRGTV